MHFIEQNQMESLSSSYLIAMGIILMIFQNPIHSLIGIIFFKTELAKNANPPYLKWR